MTKAWDPSEPLREEREKFAQLRAIGMGPVLAASAAGVTKSTAMKWGAGESPTAKKVLARIEWLRAQQPEVELPTADGTLIELRKTCDEARVNGQFKAAIDGLKFLYRVAREEEGRDGKAIPTFGEDVARATAYLRSGEDLEETG